ELTEQGLLAVLGEPGNAHGARRCLKHTSCRRAMLLDHSLEVFDPAQHAFWSQFVQQRGDGSLNGGSQLGAGRRIPLRASAFGRISHVVGRYANSMEFS